jgi:hypothetical protein
LALTRAQLLSGNSNQGVVLPGQVQAVSQGAGVTISADGQISVDAATTTGLVKLNNVNAYNAYAWPNVDGTVGQQLVTDGNGNLSWADSTSPISGGLGIDITSDIAKGYTLTASVPPVVGPGAAQAIDGSMYWDDNLGALFIYYNDGTSSQWVQAIST